MSKRRDDLYDAELERRIKYRRSKRPTMKVNSKSVFKLQRMMAGRSNAKHHS